MRSTNVSQRSSHSISSALSKPNTTTSPFVSLKATPIANVFALALPAPDIPVPAFPFLSPSAIAVPAPASTEELFKLFMQTYIDIINNQAQAPIQALAPSVSVELIE